MTTWSVAKLEKYSTGIHMQPIADPVLEARGHVPDIGGRRKRVIAWGKTAEIRFRESVIKTGWKDGSAVVVGKGGNIGGAR